MTIVKILREQYKQSSYFLITHRNLSLSRKARGWTCFNLSPLSQSIRAIVVLRISFNCSGVNGPGDFPFSYQYLSPYWRITWALGISDRIFFFNRKKYLPTRLFLNVLPKRQMKVGPRTDPATGASERAPVTRSISSTLLKRCFC